MLVNEILHTDLSPLRLTDTVNKAMLRIDLLHTAGFAVVDEEERLAGMVSLDKLVEITDEQKLLSEVELGKAVSIPVHQHLFEAARMMLARDLLLLPVVDHQMKCVGMIRKQDVLHALADVFNLSGAGSVITVELDQVDFSLSDLVRIIEMEGAKILGVAVEQPSPENHAYRVSFKLNIKDSSTVSSGLRRFGYLIVSEADSEILEENFSERADELIRYLDI